MQFHPVVKLPAHYLVFDYSSERHPYSAQKNVLWGVGKFDEKRVNMYTTPLFTTGAVRDVHMGVDLGAPVGTEVYAFADGVVHSFGYLAAEGDYGFSLVTEHVVRGERVYALHGHMAATAVRGRRKGQVVARGQVLGHVGDRSVNGGWNPHVHFQLSRVVPLGFDMPGAVAAVDRDGALEAYLDPRVVLGPLYGPSARL